ncbi:hypothetical protein BLNAU_11562 [Blattamonas nauphoetae]|uniref:Uncharacterized protein n=1 Tax=Blattamonas nauphoetae TaxID=2049346 RepID=A0ABQ9XPH0_9EUKA|nr:hypothetical protein BLNAU_11562 [Blattamonas nauphoetae]
MPDKVKISFEGAAFFCYLLLMFWSLLIISSLRKLQNHTIHTQDLCRVLNSLCMPEVIVQLIAALSHFFARQYILGLCSTPLLFKHIKDLLGRKKHYVVSEMRQEVILQHELKVQITTCIIYSVITFASIIVFLVDFAFFFV